jgi:hypothetical protein
VFRATGIRLAELQVFAQQLAHAPNRVRCIFACRRADEIFTHTYEDLPQIVAFSELTL